MKHLFYLFTAFIIFSCSESSVSSVASAQQKISADHSFIQYTGRIDFSDPKRPVFSYPGISIKIKFEGSSVTAFLKDFPNGNHANFFEVIIDDSIHSVLKLNASDTSYLVAKNLKNGVHTLELYKRTESLVGKTMFLGFGLDKEGKLVEPAAKPGRKMEFIGNSITCGYGNEGANEHEHFADSTENNYLSFGAITARNLKAQYLAVSYSGRGIYRNYGDSPDQPVPGFYERIFPDEESSPKWNVKNYVPDAVVINLGTNDFYAPGTDSTKFVSAYSAFVSKIRKNYPDAAIFCVVGPMMNDYHPAGEQALSKIRAYLTAMVNRMNDAGEKKVYFFEMSQQGKFGMGSDYHPNVKQHYHNAGELAKFVKEKMGW